MSNKATSTARPPDDGCGTRRASGALRPSVEEVALADFFEQHGTMRRLPADRVVRDFAENDLRLALVTSGMIAAAIDLPDDRRQVLCIYCPGDVIFADAFAPAATVRLRALADVELRTMSSPALDAARETAPATVSVLLLAAIEHLSELMLHSAALGRLRSEERLATFFLELALRIGQPRQGTATLNFEMRREDIADYLGLNRDTLSRAMSRLRRDHVVTYVNAGCFIVNLDALSARTPLGAALLAAHKIT